MKKKLSIIITALMLVVVVAFGIVLPIALEDDSIYYKISYAMPHYFGDALTDNDGHYIYTVRLIKSFNELKELCDEYNNTAFKEDDIIDGPYASNLNKKLREYDDKYFKNKSLIIFADSIALGYIEIVIENLKVNKDDGIIVLEAAKKIRPDCDGGILFALQWISLIEVNKADVVGVNTIDYICENDYSKPFENKERFLNI